MKFEADYRSDVDIDDEEKVKIEDLMKILQEMREKGHTHINFLVHNSDQYRNHENGSVTMEFGVMKEKKKYRVFAIVEAYSEEEASLKYCSTAVEVQEVK